MWDQIWQWMMDHFIFHVVIIALGIYFVFFPGQIGRLSKKAKKLKVGPFEYEGIDDIDPNTPCPYTKSRDLIFNALRNVDRNVGKLSEEVKEISAIVKNMSIDQQKQLFYDQDQPDAERLAGGLKYLHQGGNGHTKSDVIAFAESHKDIYNALTYVKPEFRLIYEGKK